MGILGLIGTINRITTALQVIYTSRVGIYLSIIPSSSELKQSPMHSDSSQQTMDLNQNGIYLDFEFIC